MLDSVAADMANQGSSTTKSDGAQERRYLRIGLAWRVVSWTLFLSTIGVWSFALSGSITGPSGCTSLSPGTDLLLVVFQLALAVTTIVRTRIGSTLYGFPTLSVGALLWSTVLVLAVFEYGLGVRRFFCPAGLVYYVLVFAFVPGLFLAAFALWIARGARLLRLAMRRLRSSRSPRSSVE